MEINQIRRDAQIMPNSLGHIVNGQLSVPEDGAECSCDTAAQAFKVSASLESRGVGPKLSRDHCAFLVADAPLMGMDLAVGERTASGAFYGLLR